MQITRPVLNNVALATLALFFLTVATEVMAPPGGGAPGGFGRPMGRMHHNRIGPASGGSFTSKPMPRRAKHPASKPTTRSPVKTSPPRQLAAAPLNESQARRQKIRKNYADQRKQIHEKYESQRQQVRDKYANQRLGIRDKYENQRQQIHETHEDQPEQVHAVRDDHREEIREVHEDHREEVRDEHWDHWRHRRHRTALGTVYTTEDFSDEDCEASMVVDGVTFYACDGVWYKRAYSGGTVTYVVVDRPRND